MANTGFSFDMKDMLKGLEGAESSFDAALRMYAETSAKKLEGAAKQNRRWTDRTGHARQRLNGSVGKVSEGYRLYLAHGVDYGIWLELAHERKYSIIPETIRYVGTFEIIPGLERLFERMGGK